MELTIKEARYVKAKLEGKNQIEAGRFAGAKTEQGARKLAHRLSQKVKIQKVLESAREVSLLEAGITRAKALKPIADALEASKTIVHGKGADDGGVEVVPDHSIRLKAAEMSLKLLGQQKEPDATESKLNRIDLSGLDEVRLSEAVFKKSGVSEPVKEVSKVEE